MNTIRTQISQDGVQAQLTAEVKSLTAKERQALLLEAGISIDIPPGKGLAMKADLALSWNKLRIIRR